MNLLDAKILKDSSAYELLKDMIRPDMEKEVRVAVEREVRVAVEREVRVEEARSLLIGLATDRFGEPTETQQALLDGITDHDRLVRLCKKVGSLATWDELLSSESSL